MRAGFLDVAVRALREGRVPWLIRQAGKYAAVQAASRAAVAPATGPIMAGLVTTYRCNERCLMCDLPMRPDAEARDELPTARWLGIIDELARAGTSGVSVTGGEPLLRADTPALIARARSHGLPVTLNTNGLLFGRDDRVDAVLAADPTNINVSVDGTTEALHDELRGLPGAWRTLREAVPKLLRRREQTGSRARVTAVCVLSPRNVDQLDGVLAECARLGFDAVGFLPVHTIPSNERRRGALPLLGVSDPAARRRSLGRIVEAVEQLLALKSSAGPIAIDNSAGYLEALPLAFMGEPSPVACVTGYIRSVVDPYGDVYPCWPYLEWKRGLVGNVRERPWDELWRSAPYQAARDETSACRECFWNCQTEGNLLFRRPERSGLEAARRALAAEQ